MFEKVNENFVCRAVLQNVYTILKIPIEKVDASDITADGVIYYSQACLSSLIYINKKGKICTKAETNSNEIYKRQYSESFSKALEEHVLKQTIVKFRVASLKFDLNMLLLNTRSAETENMKSDSGTFQQPHGNSKKRKEPYMRTFPSVIKRLNLFGQFQLQKTCSQTSGYGRWIF